MRYKLLLLLLACLLALFGGCRQGEYVHDGENDPGPPYSLGFSSLAAYGDYVSGLPVYPAPDGGIAAEEDILAARQALEAMAFPVTQGGTLTYFNVTWRSELETVWVRYETPQGAGFTFTLPLTAAGQDSLAQEITKGEALPARHMELLCFTSKYEIQDKGQVYVYTAQVGEEFMLIRAFNTTQAEAAQVLAEVEFAPLLELCQAAEAKGVIQAQYAADVDLAAYPGAFEVADALSADGYALQILLTVNEPVTDFRYFVLESDDSGENIQFSAGEELYAVDELTANTPLLVWAAFPGVLPTRGLAFTDPAGAVHCCALGQSGEDGSLLLMEF